MATVGQLVVNLLGNTAPFKAAFNEIPGFLGGITGRVTALLGVGGGLGAVGTGVKLAADAEQMQVAFETMLGSATKAKSMLAEIKQFAMKSPFTQIATTESAQLLLNFGIAAEQVMPMIRMLGDVASGDEQKLRGLSLAFAQMTGQGRLMGQDLNQMVNAGFNPLSEIAKRTGESMGALKARMEAGGIGIDEVRQAFVDATSEGGRFFNMNDKQSRTLSGRFSTLKDEVNESLREIGVQLIETFNFAGWVNAASNSLSEFRSWIQTSGHDVVIFAGAVFGFVSALVAVRTAIQAATIATAIWKSISSPAGFALVAAGILGAAAAVAGLEEMFTSSANRAMALSAAARDASASLREVGASTKEMATAGGDALSRALAQLKQIQEARSKGASGNYAARLDREEADVRGRIAALTTFSQPADKKLEQINLLHDRIQVLRGAVDGLTESERKAMILNLENQIGDLSGATDKIRDLKQEIQGVSQIQLDAMKLSQAGATNEQVTDFIKLREAADRMKELRGGAADLINETRTPLEKFQKRLDDLAEMRKKGLIDEDTFKRGTDLASKEMAKREDALAREQDADKKETRSTPLEAMLKDTRSAADAIARGMLVKNDNPNRKLETLVERQTRAVEESKRYLATIAGKEPEAEEVVDF